MRVLVVCDYGINRSVTIASMLKFQKHDTIAAGIHHTSRGTLDMLTDWADRVIVVEPHLEQFIKDPAKVRVWDVGPDKYPRPYNKELYRKVQNLIREHAEDLNEHATV